MASMELNVCPACNSFVGRDWTACKSCGRELEIKTDEQAAPEDDSAETGAPVAPEKEAATENDAPADSVETNDEAPEESAPAPDGHHATMMADFPEETPEQDVTEAPAEPEQPPIGESTLKYPKSSESLLSGSVIAIAAVIIVVIALLTAAVFYITSTDDKPVLPAPTTTSTLVPQLSFQDPEGRFAATLPAEATRSNYDFGGLTATQYTATVADKQLTAVIIVADLPAGTKSTENEVELRQQLKVFEALYGHKLGSSLAVRDKDPWTLDATLTQGNVRTNYRLFVQNNRLYQLYVQAPEGTPGAPQAFSTLVDSFKAS